MTRINYTTFPSLLLRGLLVLAFLSAGCGEEEEVKDDATTYSLDFSVADSESDTTGWHFNNDTTVAAADSESTGDAAGDVATDGGDVSVDASDVTISVDAGPAEIKSCGGHCGINLEFNPCHCDHGCVDRGDCCGDFADFTYSCSCATKSDCDDGNFCTTDSCQTAAGGKKWCKQIPFLNCCNADSECGAVGKNKCVTPTCLQGSCSDVEKNCDDGVSCTLDVCDPASAECAHKLSSTKCLIDGACHGAGASKPNSGGCMLCQPDKASDAWTPKVGTCLIDGICSKSGEKASPAADECRVCDPSKSTTTWSVASGACLIDGTCHATAAKSPTNPDCATCQPTKSATAWSGVSGKCAVGDKCYSAGEGDPAISCATCDPASSSSSLTPAKGFCVIAGACVASGGGMPGAFGCQICDATKAVDSWTMVKPGTKCSDNDPCSIDTLCTTAGVCKGKTQPNCCKTDAECIGKVNPEACQKVVCKGTGVCGVVDDPNCCSSGKCCDIAAGKLKPAGTACSTFSIGLEYKCEGTKGYKRNLFPGCTGLPGEENKCSQSQPSPGPWLLSKTCSGGTSCVLGSKTSPPICK